MKNTMKACGMIATVLLWNCGSDGGSANPLSCGPGSVDDNGKCVPSPDAGGSLSTGGASGSPSSPSSPSSPGGPQSNAGSPGASIIAFQSSAGGGLYLASPSQTELQSVGPTLLNVMNIDATAVTAVLSNAFVNVRPNFAPDGKLIAYASTADDAAGDIYTLSATGGSVTRVTNNNVKEIAPSISPDNAKIVFVSARDGHDEIYVMQADGTAVTRLTNTPTHVVNASPCWTPDGTRIVFASTRSGRSQIYQMSATDGSAVTRLTNDAHDAVHPNVSPDGKNIIFASDRDSKSYQPDTYNIYEMLANGSIVTRITNAEGSDGGPVYTLDGTSILYHHANVITIPPLSYLGDNQIYSVTRATKSVTRVTKDSNNDTFPTTARGIPIGQKGSGWSEPK